MGLREDLKKAIKREMDLADTAYSSATQDDVIERILDEIEATLKKYAALGTLAQQTEKSPPQILSADPLGAERRAREL